MAIEFEDFRRKMNQLTDQIGDAAFSFSVAAAKDAEGQLKARIFNSVTGARDVDGNDLGGYKSKSHRKRRERRGAQTSKKDFVLSDAEDGSLFSSMITGEDPGSGQATVNWADDKSALIAEGLEAQGAATRNQPNKVIFSLSDTELKDVQDNLDDLIISHVDDLQSQIFGR